MKFHSVRDLLVAECIKRLLTSFTHRWVTPWHQPWNLSLRETQTHCYHISITIAGTFSPPRKPPPALANEMLIYDKWLSDQMWLKFSPVGEQSNDYLHWIYGIQIITQIVSKKLAVIVMFNTKLNIHSSRFLKKMIHWGYSAGTYSGSEWGKFLKYLKSNLPLKIKKKKT